MGKSSNKRKNAPGQPMGYDSKYELFVLGCITKTFVLCHWDRMKDLGAVEALEQRPDEWIDDMLHATGVAAIVKFPEVACNTQLKMHIADLTRAWCDQVLEWWKNGSPETDEALSQ